MATLPPLTTSLNYTIAVLSAYGEFDGVPLTHDQIVYQLTHYDESKVGSLIAAVDIMLVATTLAVAMRLLSRKLKKVKLDVDDYMALIGLVIVSLLTGRYRCGTVGADDILVLNRSYFMVM